MLCFVPEMVPAIRFQRLLDRGEVKDYAELARLVAQHGRTTDGRCAAPFSRPSIVTTDPS
jgi:hypothetical protein